MIDTPRTQAKWDMFQRREDSAECVKHESEKLELELYSLCRKYEELRALIDGNSESMTHQDAVAELADLVRARR